MSQPSGPLLRSPSDGGDAHLATALQLLESGAFELAVIAAQLHLRDALRRRSAPPAGVPATSPLGADGLGGEGQDQAADLLRHTGRFHDALAGGAAFDHAAALDSIITVWNLAAAQAPS